MIEVTSMSLRRSNMAESSIPANHCKINTMLQLATNFDNEEFATADAEIAVAHPRIDRKRYDWIHDGPRHEGYTRIGPDICY